MSSIDECVFPECLNCYAYNMDNIAWLIYIPYRSIYAYANGKIELYSSIKEDYTNGLRAIETEDIVNMLCWHIHEVPDKGLREKIIEYANILLERMGGVLYPSP